MGAWSRLNHGTIREVPESVLKDFRKQWEGLASLYSSRVYLVSPAGQPASPPSIQGEQLQLHLKRENDLLPAGNHPWNRVTGPGGGQQTLKPRTARAPRLLRDGGLRMCAHSGPHAVSRLYLRCLCWRRFLDTLLGRQGPQRGPTAACSGPAGSWTTARQEIGS